MDKETKKGMLLVFLVICATWWFDPLLYYVTENGNYSYAIWNSFFPELVLLGLISIILAFPFSLIIITPIEYLLRENNSLHRFKKMRGTIFWKVASSITAVIIMINLLEKLSIDFSGQDQNVYLEMHFLSCQMYYFMILNLCFFHG
jgi:hypothetical protein